MNPSASKTRRIPWDFVLLTYAISWTLFMAGWFGSGKPDTTTQSSLMLAFIYAGSFGPGIAAAILTGRQGRQQFFDWLRAFLYFRCGWRAYASLLLFPIVILLLTIVLGYTPKPGASGGLDPILFYVTIFPASLINGMMTAITGAGPLGEEGGWRGYLLPRLLETGGEARASFIIGVIWSLWHLPVMILFADWRDGVDFWTYLPIYTIFAVAMSFLMTRIWLVGRGSLVPVIWFHGIVNAIGGVAFTDKLWGSMWPNAFGGVWFALGASIAATIVVWLGWGKQAKAET